MCAQGIGDRACENLQVQADLDDDGKEYRVLQVSADGHAITHQ